MSLYFIYLKFLNKVLPVDTCGFHPIKNTLNKKVSFSHVEGQACSWAILSGMQAAFLVFAGHS